jgi:predicted TIM-barrel fold metal-dependent hydrolase
VIIDFHTHIFSPDVRPKRDDCARRDATFAEMYADPRAEIATAADLLASMDASKVDVSVACGFAWGDHEDIAHHNYYLLEAAKSNNRFIPFTTINMADERAEAEIARCAAMGARGLGELRPDSQGWDLNGEAGQRLSEAAREHNLILLFHVTEEGGHEYPGKHGCSLASFREFAQENADLPLVGAHLGGEIYRESGQPDVFVDTAAIRFLHKPPEQSEALGAVPADRLLFGSDFPLITQERAIRELRESIDDANDLESALGGNATSLLGLTTKTMR